MPKIAVIIYGPPGSGKGTQAGLLEDYLNAIHFDTGKFLESVVHDPKRQREPAVRRERKLFDTGILMTPSFVFREVKKEAVRIAKAGWSVVFSGSPRTMYEAERLVPVLERLFGKKNIFVFVLRVPPRDSLTRNGARFVCTVCKRPVLIAYYPSSHPRYCPACGGSVYRRTLDKPVVIKVRLEEYKNRTEPIFRFLRARGYCIREIDGRPAPYKVFSQIYRHVRGR